MGGILGVGCVVETSADKMLPSPRRRRRGWATWFARRPRWSRIRCVRRVAVGTSQQEAVHGRRRKRDGRRWARKRHRAPASLFRGVHRSNMAASDTFLPGGRRRCRDVASKKQMGRHAICRRRWASSCCRRHAIRSASQLLRFGGTSTYLGCVWAPLLRSSRRQFLGAKLPLAP